MLSTRVIGAALVAIIARAGIRAGRHTAHSVLRGEFRRRCGQGVLGSVRHQSIQLGPEHFLHGRRRLRRRGRLWFQSGLLRQDRPGRQQCAHGDGQPGHRDSLRRPAGLRLRPYGIVGAGLLKSKSDFGTGVAEIDENDLTWSAGGGLLLFFGSNAGLRFDVRYFRTFDDLEILGVPIAQSPGKVDFTRGSLGFVFRF